MHLLTYVGIALSFLHQLAGPDLAGHRLLQVAWALLYAQVHQADAADIRDAAG